MRKNEKITALYERLSRDDFGKDDDQQRESNSISNQKAMLEEFAARQGFTNIVHFTLDHCPFLGSHRNAQHNIPRSVCHLLTVLSAPNKGLGLSQQAKHRQVLCGSVATLPMLATVSPSLLQRRHSRNLANRRQTFSKEKRHEPPVHSVPYTVFNFLPRCPSLRPATLARLL